MNLVQLFKVNTDSSLSVISSYQDITFDCQADFRPGTVQFSLDNDSAISLGIKAGTLLRIKVDNNFIKESFYVEARGSDFVSEDGVASKQFKGRSSHVIFEDDVVLPSAWPSSSPAGHSFQNSTPGNMIKTLVLRAQERGTLVGVTTNSFNGTSDSNGAAWPSMMDRSFNAGDSILSVIQSLVDQGQVEAEMVGLDLRLYKPGTLGRSIPASEFVLRAAQNLAEGTSEEDSTEFATDIYAVGEGTAVTQKTRPSAYNVLGRRRVRFANYGGIADVPLLGVLADSELDMYTHIKREDSISIAHTILSPFQDYNVGDWVYLAREVSNPPEQVQIKQISVQVNNKGDISVGVSLGDLLDSADTKLKRRLDAITGTNAGGGAIPSDKGNDKNPPANVSNLTISKLAYVDDARARKMIAVIDWSDVTQNADGTPASDVSYYEVRVKVGNATDYGPITKATTSIAYFSGYAPNTTIQAQVRAVDDSGLASPSWTTSTVFALTDPAPYTPPTASKPAVAASQQSLNITWDGKDSAGTFATPDVTGAVVHMSTTSAAFTPSSTTNIGFIPFVPKNNTGGNLTLSGLEPSKTYYVRLVLVANSGNTGAASATGQATTGAYFVDPGVVTQVQKDMYDAAGTVETMRNTLTGQVSAADAKAQAAQSAANQAAADASNAVGLAGSKADVFIQSAAPGVSFQKDTTLWIDTTDGINAPKKWNGSAWIAVTDKAATDAAAAAVLAQNKADLAKQTADTAQTTANRKISVYTEPTTPTAPTGGFSVGDVWFKTSDQNRPYTWNGSTWIDVRDQSIAAASSSAATALTNANAAMTAAQAAQAAADGAISTYYQEDPPWADNSSQPSSKLGDLWYKTSTNQAYRWNGTTWALITDNQIAAALAAAQNAQTTADGKIDSFYQAAPPAVCAVGDLWFDTDDKNKPYYCTKASPSPTWTPISDGRIADAQAKADQAYSDAGTAITKAQTAQSTADGKAVVYFQNTVPVGQNNTTDKNNMWVDTANGNRVSIWNGSAWVVAQDQGISTALTNAAAAQTTANKKITTYYLSSTPTTPAEGFALGDLWFNTANQNELKRWSGSAWTSVRDGSIADAQAKADQAFTNAGTAITNAQTAQSIADKKAVVYYQGTAPTGQNSTTDKNNMWIDTANGNLVKIWSGTAWVAAQDQSIVAALNNADMANANALAASNSALSAVGIASSKGQVFFGTSAPNVVQRTNLLLNPTFGADTTSWAATRGTLSRNAAAGYSGAGYLVYTSTDASSAGGNYLWHTYANTTPEQAYTYSAYVRTPRANERGRVWIQWYNSANTLLSSSTPAGTELLTQNAWQRLSFTGTAPANAVKAQVFISVTPASAGIPVNGTFDVDAALFEQSVDLQPYFDGSVVSTDSAVVYGWTGTANASTSNQYSNVSLWIDTTNGANTPKKFTPPNTWTAITDKAATDAASVAAKAQQTADYKITTYYGSTAPAAPTGGFTIGDMWIDQANKNQMKRWSGTAWVDVRDQTIADAQSKANQAALDAGTAITNAQTAQSVADKKAVVYIQATAPTGQNSTTDKNNLWVDTSNGNVVKAWSGTAWVTYQDQSISTALTNAAAAQTTANKKITTYYLPTAPTAPSEGFSVGDLWINTGSNSQVNRWDGTRWVLTSIASTDYVASRGTDLVTNGTGLLGNNTNFTGFIYEPTDAPVGANGSFRSATYMDDKFSDELIPVDPSKKYVLTVKARQRVAGKASRAYAGLAPFDAQGNPIVPQHYVHDRRTDATLTVALNPGDTTMKVSALTAAYWTHTPAYKIVGVWNWTDPTGRVWPLGTYTRNTPSFASVDEATKTITLSAAYTGPAMPVGTPITRNFPGGNYMYTGPVNEIIPEAWTTYQSPLIGGLYDGNSQNVNGASTSFPPGCTKVKIVFSPNRDVTGGEHAWAGISFSDSAAAQATADAAQVTASSKNTILWSLSDAPASAPGSKNGDIWNKYQIISGKMSILRTWRSDGASWVESVLTETYLPQVNIGTGTYGELDGIRLKARSVNADQIAAGAIVAEKVNAQSVSSALAEFQTVKAENIQAGFITAGMAFSTGSFVAGQIFGKCAQMNANGFSTLQVAEDGTQYVSTTLGNPNGTDSLAVFNAPNTPPVFEVSSDGAVSAADLAVTADPTIAGRPLLGKTFDSAAETGWIDDLPKGIIGRGSLRPLVSGKSVTNGFQDLGIMSFTAQPDRSYRITLPYAYVPTLSSGAQAQVSLIAFYTLGTTATPQPADPTRSSGRLGQASKQVTLSTTSYPVTDVLSFVFDAVNTVPVEMRILFSSFAGPNLTMGYSVADNTTWNAIIEDVGTSVPDTARLATAPSISTYTRTYTASDSRSYNGDGSPDTFGNSKTILRHGQYLSANGNLRSAVVFPAAMSTDLSGATITKAEIYVESLHWATSTGGTARFFPMTGGTLPGSITSVPGTPVVKRFTARNQGFWLQVPTSWFSASNRGFIIGPAADASQNNYGYFAAHNHAKTTARPKVRLTYTK